MPFTLAHPAIVLPLRRRLWFPGLVAGSIAPDVGYYVPLGVDGELTHAPLGVPVDLLLGALLLLVGWAAYRPLLSLLGKTASATWPGLWRALVAMTVGAATHLVWDTFTHTDGWAVQHWAALRISIVGPHRLYNVIGYVSSIVGLLVLGWFAARWYSRAESTPPAAHRIWVLAAFSMTAVVSGAIATTDPLAAASSYDCVRLVLISAIQSAGIAFGVYAMIVSGYTALGDR